jgi:hypothetical protein
MAMRSTFSTFGDTHIKHTDNSNLKSVHSKLDNTRNSAAEVERITQQRDKAYDDYTLKLTAYWVDRVRSSIAHHKIGKYMMTNNDEDFMLNFVEPLLDELIKQCFKA